MSKNIRDMSPQEIREHARKLAEETSQRFQQEVKETTTEELINQLSRVFIESPEPEEWTEWEQNTLTVINRTIFWLQLRRDKLAEPRP